MTKLKRKIHGSAISTKTRFINEGTAVCFYQTNQDRLKQVKDWITVRHSLNRRAVIVYSRQPSVTQNHSDERTITCLRLIAIDQF